MNLDPVKGFVVSVTGAIGAIMSGISGLSPQGALAPSLTWLVGSSREKARGTALFAAAVGAPVSAAVIMARTGASATYLYLALVSFLGATIGALVGVRTGPPRATRVPERVGALAGMAVTVYLMVQAAHLSKFNTDFHLYRSTSASVVFLLAIAGGALTQVLGLTGGLAYLSIEYLFTGLTFHRVVLLSLLVIAIASALTVPASVRRGAVDQRYRGAVAAGCAVGGMIGGIVFALPAFTERAAIACSAVMGMFLCARELATARTDVPDTQ